ncbi:hypothetical protein EV182_004445 [Spiromyces aspiralis]|uniref:Uncharacterized protein n=1 Tax=Spiromyces aspiralis TaxID=68401 RepID=A0ACC1HP24_9FUNG|nr:hypothetical protein EV182_004445 [Spiromyces aspiralis]
MELSPKEALGATAAVLMLMLAMVATATVEITSPSSSVWMAHGQDFTIKWTYDKSDTELYNRTHIFLENQDDSPPVSRELASGPFEGFTQFTWNVPDNFDGGGWEIALRNSSDTSTKPFATSDKFTIVMVDGGSVIVNTSDDSSASDSGSSSEDDSSSDDDSSSEEYVMPKTSSATSLYRSASQTSSIFAMFLALAVTPIAASLLAVF